MTKLVVPFVDLKAQYRGIQTEIHEAIEKVLEKQRFILDSEVSAFEEEISQFCETRFAVACASGTDAILLSLLALGVGEKDEVITTSYSFFSTAGMISWLKARPIFVDIDPKNYNLDADQVRERITSKTKAVIAVHLFGKCANMEKLLSLGVPVIEDAAQAIGAFRTGRSAGSMGITGCFSFFPTKNLGAYGDGGMITTNSEHIARKLRQLRAHGQDAQTYVHSCIGTNSRLDELQAAILRTKLQYLGQWNARRKQNAQFYMEQMKQLPVQLPYEESPHNSTFHQFVIRTPNRERLRATLSENGISTAVYYPVPLPLQPCFSYLGHRSGDFPEAEKCAASALALPVYPELSEEQLRHVVSSIRSFFDRSL